MDEVAGVDGALRALLGDLPRLAQGVSDAVRIDRIRVLEELKAAVAAAQARETAAFAASQRAAQAAAGVPGARVGRGVAAQVGLARRISPFQARRDVGWAQLLIAELPATFAQLQAGRVSEWRAILVARETAWLSAEHRAVVDAHLAPQLPALGDRRVEAEARRLAYRLDPAGALARVRGAEADRRVTLRPAPDTMARLSALLPVAHGVAAYAALSRAADSGVAAGDGRGRGQLMADTLVERLTGQASASAVPIEINLVMTDRALLAGDDEPALLDNGIPVPAEMARELVKEPDARTARWLRRLYTSPDRRHLLAMDSCRRHVPPQLRHFIALRDQTCRTPWCEAPSGTSTT